MARHYFFFIDLPDTSFSQKMILGLKKPIRFWWMFEQAFIKIKFPRKKLLLAAVGAFLISMPFLGADVMPSVDWLYHTLGWSSLIGGLLLMAVAFISYPLEKHFMKKHELRQRLVN